jgi:FkbM family methyltransferase
MPMLDTVASTAPITLAYAVRDTAPRLVVHDRLETISNFVRAHNVWQRQVTAFITGYLRPGDVFVDVGANIGYFTVYAGLCVGNAGQVHAIEPAAENLRLLEANVSLNGLSNVTVHSVAVSNRGGEAPLFRAGFNSGAHSMVQKDGLTEGPRVPVVRLDALLAGERPPTLIKIDVQGAEFQVLESMTRLLTSPSLRPAIVVEFSPMDLARHGHFDQFFNFIAHHDYSLRAFIANERQQVKPPQVRRATLRQIAKDLLSANDPAELDVLLLPHK